MIRLKKYGLSIFQNLRRRPSITRFRWRCSLMRDCSSPTSFLMTRPIWKAKADLLEPIPPDCRERLDFEITSRAGGPRRTCRHR